MQHGPLFIVVTAFSLFAAEDQPAKIPLSIPAGAPLRLYLTRRVPKRIDAPVEAKVMESLFAFDREVVPAGSVVTGKVSRLQPAGKWRRFQAIVNGDFTPLHGALVQFDSLKLPDGKIVPIHTMETVAMNSIYREPSSKKKKAKSSQPQAQNNGLLGTAKQTAKNQLQGAVNSRTRGIADLVRGPDKKERTIDFLWAKLPYHPQYMRHGARFDAPLSESLEFGEESVKVSDLAQLGAQPAPDSVARVRLLTALDSHTSKQGETVEATVVAPMYSADRKLVMPEGTRLIGTVTVATHARSFHRGGKLRFSFQKVELPTAVAGLRPAVESKTQATLSGAEGSGPAPINVDSEGGVQAKESKTRFVAPVISLMLASRAADNDAGHHHADGSTGEANVSGRTLGGGMGFGLLGSAVSQSSRYVGMAFGYYGLAWSVYNNVVAKGGEVQFDKNAMMEVKFGRPPVVEGNKIVAADERR
ncbi:MAG TPA: hypothetical protein VG456_05890 [Candidatus Sulfopaludibacter sp.]|nr:hypothetical protein [Candidatus Sulfopaludibacter sp.]